MNIRSASAYAPADDLCVVTTYFNPLGYVTKRRNYEVFRQPFAVGGLALLTVECAFGSDPFTLPPGPDVVQVRGQHVMWQKERLLNLAVARLPRRYVKVAWVDCDILFENPTWAVATSRVLDTCAVAQPFTTAIRLPRDPNDPGSGQTWRSFAAVRGTDPDSLGNGDYDRHGETGFAWAARRDVLGRHDLYDACIIGGGDHVMAHAWCGDWTSVCIDRLLGVDNAHVAHFRRWAQATHRTVGAKIGCVPGSAFHLWHGEVTDRGYSSRHRELVRWGFDPTTDLRVGAGGCWEWATARTDIQQWAAGYFARRLEDGTPGTLGTPPRESDRGTLPQPGES